MRAKYRTAPVTFRSPLAGEKEKLVTLETLATFLGWALVVNLVFYTITAVALMAFRGLVADMSARLFGIDRQVAINESFAYLARFKLLVMVFFLAPWVALKLMA